MQLCYLGEKALPEIKENTFIGKRGEKHYVCSTKIYYVVITKFKDSSILNKNNSYNYTYCIVPCQVIPTNIT